MKVSALVSCFNGAKYLPAFLDNAAEQTIAAQTEIVLVHNDPDPGELGLVEDFAGRYPGVLTHLVVPREPLAVSTNRAARAAQADYVCVWNVDDLRTPDSLQLMAQTLDARPNVGFTYGDYVLVEEFQATSGRSVGTPEFDRRAFTRSMLLGPFYMWRKELGAEIGYWDEQLRMGGDFDYAIRLALTADGEKTHGILGYYLDEGLGLSTGPTPLQRIERTMLELRYGSYDKVEVAYWRAARRYRLDAVRAGSDWIQLDDLVGDRLGYARSRAWLAVAVLRAPWSWLLRIGGTITNRLRRKRR